MGKYKFLNHTADIAIQVTADNAEDLFITAWKAWQHIVFESQQIKVAKQNLIELHCDSLEELLVESLKEINYLYLVKGLIFSSSESLTVNKMGGFYNLNARINVDIFSPDKHSPTAEIKAITYHRLNIQNLNNQLQTDIVFDI